METNEVIEQELTDIEITAQEVQESAENIQYVPTKEDFYLTPFLLCIIILMLFLKWCFPMKGGRNI